jgi:hypothetical protein
MVDFRRVALHAFGHLLGLTHPDLNGQSVAAIMNSSSHEDGGSADDLQDDDMRGARALYGTAPAPSVPAPAAVPRAESIDFRRAMEPVYRSRGRLTRTFVDIDASAIWMSEYFWYRVSYCDHATAMARVFAEIEGRGVQPLCAEPSSKNVYPPLDDSYAFRAKLEIEFRDVLKSVEHEYYLTLDEDALLMSSYHLYRWFEGLSHAQAVEKVINPTAPTPGFAEFSGSWSGTFTGQSSGTLSFTIADATITVTQPTQGDGILTLGSIGTDTSFFTRGPEGSCTWTGPFLPGGARQSSGSGLWSCGNGRNGAWSATRAAAPAPAPPAPAPAPPAPAPAPAPGTASVSPKSVDLGTTGGCNGGIRTAVLNFTAPSNLRWYVQTQNPDSSSSSYFTWTPDFGTGSAAVTFTLTQAKQTPICDRPATRRTLQVSFVNRETGLSVADATIVHTFVGY